MSAPGRQAGVDGWVVRSEALRRWQVSAATLKRRVRAGVVRRVTRRGGRGLYWVEDLEREFGAPGDWGKELL